MYRTPEMNFKLGLEILRDLAQYTQWYADFIVYEAALYENISSESRFGPDEQTRRERSRIVDQLNKLALEHLGVSFNDMCLGKRTSGRRELIQEGQAQLKAADSSTDVAILTVLPEEYRAVYKRLHQPRPAPVSSTSPNTHAWVFGQIPYRNTGTVYSIVLGLTGHAGTSHTALAVMDTIKRWKPRYVFFVGIAGGFELGGMRKGDVVVADVIFGYEYGKVEKDFQPRHDWTYRTDLALLTSATTFANLNSDWMHDIGIDPPEPISPRVFVGHVASGDKVVDNPTSDFFVEVTKAWEKIQAVEMEGAGVALAVEHAQSSGVTVGFLMIRGISDMPRPATGTEPRGTEERDMWKDYATHGAAAFTTNYIADQLPVPPLAWASAQNQLTDPVDR